MATPGPSPSKLVEDSDVAAFSPQPLGNQQALEVEDVIKFVEPLPDELQCPLCLQFLKEPTLTSCCGHHFCRECINRAITRSHVCPLCNDQGFQTLLNKEKQRLVNTLKVYCKWKSQGCEWVGDLGRLEHHLDVEEGDCSCVEVECEFGPVGCVAKLPRKDLQRHKEENVHKHLVLMSVMSLKSNEAFVKELQEQRVELEGQFRKQQVEFQQQLRQKDEEIQCIRQLLQQQVKITQELRGQLQQDMESKQQMITNLERQLARVEVELTENAQQFVKVERKLQDRDQQWLGDVERKWLEEKKVVSRQVSEFDKKVEEAKLQFLQGHNQSVVETVDLRKRIEQMETSFGEEQDQINEKLEANEKRVDDVERRQLEEKQQVVGQVAEVDRKVEEAKLQLQKGHNQTVVETADLRKRIEQMETSLGEEKEQVNEKIEANEKRLDDVEWKQQEEKQEIIDLGRRLGQAETSLGDSQGQVREVKELIQKLEQGCSETAEEIMGRLGQVEGSLEESKTLVEQVNDRIQKLEKHTFIPPPVFTMTDFEKHKKDGDQWFSPPFYSHIEGYKMCLRVCANGQDEGEGTYVSLFVHLMRGEHDNCLKWPFCGRITVKLLNQRREDEHVKLPIHFDDSVCDEAGCRVIEREEAMMGFGYITGIAHSALGYNCVSNTEYLTNDCLKFQVTNIKLTDF